MVDHYNVILTLTLIIPMVSLISMAETQPSIEDFRQLIGIDHSPIWSATIPNTRVMDKAGRLMRQFTNPYRERDPHNDSPQARFMDYAIKRALNLNGLKWLDQFDDQRANLDALLAGRGLNNWKREGAETYKNMFLGVRG
ncbi:uncharacterized protein LOC128388870 [Panonychus citri]|uniref:uncharacterized protein LOC128388870 n=1 Tax=Panonychus citri TaxID=50023 RepID=UPI0023080DD7|nr:uncharacterized protein LOC128388870 [Panonychus citri]